MYNALPERGDEAPINVMKRGLEPGPPLRYAGRGCSRASYGSSRLPNACQASVMAGNGFVMHSSVRAPSVYFERGVNVIRVVFPDGVRDAESPRVTSNNLRTLFPARSSSSVSTSTW